MVGVTEHGKLRVKQRVNIGKSTEKIIRVATMAYDRGIKPEEAKGRLGKYVGKQIIDDELSYSGRTVEVRVFAGKVWIFSVFGLVTVKTLNPLFWKSYEATIKAVKSSKRF